MESVDITDIAQSTDRKTTIAELNPIPYTLLGDQEMAYPFQRTTAIMTMAKNNNHHNHNHNHNHNNNNNNNNNNNPNSAQSVYSMQHNSIY